jgi:two-component system phosphate regulon sensor histidine kinase PhoR
LRDEETSQDYRVHIVAMDPTDQMCDYVLVFIEETAQKDLQQLKRHMMRIGSHDLKAPLHIALGYINMLQADIAQGQTIEPTWIDEISRAIAKMNKLVDELLSEERLERESRYRRQAISLKALIARVVDEFEPMLKARNHSLALEIAADIPTMSGDSRQIREAMAHYLRNAVQYSPDGGTITIRATCEDDIFRFEVQDTGIGIPEDLQANLFQPGYRAPRPAIEDIPGAGNGLSLVAEICRRHKGKVCFESQENEGSTFGFSLPISVSE